MKRPNISAADKVTVVLEQCGGVICPLCHHTLRHDEPRILEHMIPRAWTKSDALKDLAFVHKACADLKTFGNKATSAGGDIHKIAKAKRLKKAREAHEAILRGEPKPPGTIKSRGFQGHRKFNGEAVWRKS